MSALDWPLKFGVFMAPFHPPGSNPTLYLERDLDLIVHLDKVGYDEAWIGEHHSAGHEIIASPEVFIAVAAERTKHMRLGTGVNSLPYHHPLILADRMVLLDHLTRGRIMLGCGPGSLPSDAFMMGIEVAKQRDMLEEGLEAITRLLDGETVTMTTDWFRLQDARLQLRPYSSPRFEIAVAGMVSPSGPRAAGRFGHSLLSIGATQTQGFDLLGMSWGVMEERAQQFGTSVRRRDWRLVGPIHCAETKADAYREVEFGLARWNEYFAKVAALPLAPESDDTKVLADAMNDAGFAVIGTPDDVAAQIQRLIDQSGGFGTMLFMVHDWADPEATKRSYELVAREVFPRFQGSATSLSASRDWAAANRPTFIGATTDAIMAAYAKHQAEQAPTPE